MHTTTASRALGRAWTSGLRATALLMLLLVSAGCATGGADVGGAVPRVSALPEVSALESARAGVGQEEYRIGPRDLLEISVFGQEALDRTVRVGGDGRVSLPLAGSIEVGGRTPHEVETALADALRARFLQDPQVSVFVKEYASQRVTVDGAVQKPGIYPLQGRTTLLQVIATAQGLDPLADPGGVVVFRTIDGQRMAAVFDVRAIRRGRAVDPLIVTEDMVVVEQSASRTALRRFIETVPAIGVFGLFR